LEAKSQISESRGEFQYWKYSFECEG
jgi:hypothetical protein